MPCSLQDVHRAVLGDEQVLPDLRRPSAQNPAAAQHQVGAGAPRGAAPLGDLISASRFQSERSREFTGCLAARRSLWTFVIDGSRRFRRVRAESRRALRREAAAGTVPSPRLTAPAAPVAACRFPRPNLGPPNLPELRQPKAEPFRHASAARSVFSAPFLSAAPRFLWRNCRFRQNDFSAALPR